MSEALEMNLGEGCKGCRHYVGGLYDFCAANLEDECAAGEGFEAWEADEDE